MTKHSNHFHRTFLAIDIDDSSIKIAEVCSDSGRIKSLGGGHLPSGCIRDGYIVNQNVVLETIRKSLIRMGINFSDQYANLSISGEPIVFKIGGVECGTDSEVINRGRDLAEQIIEMNFEEGYFSCCPLRNEPNSDGKVSVIMALAKKEVVDQRISLLDALNMRAGIIDLGFTCMVNMFNRRFPNNVLTGYIEPSSAIGVVNVGLASSDVIVIKNGEFLYGRRGLSVENVMIDDGSENPDLQKPFASKVKEAFEHYFMSVEDDAGPLKCIFLTGSSPDLICLQKEIDSSMSIPVRIFSPFDQADVNAPRIPSAGQNLNWGVIAGLALRNPIGAEEKAKQNLIRFDLSHENKNSRKVNFSSLSALREDSEEVHKALLGNRIKVREIGDPDFDRYRIGLGPVTGIYAIFCESKIVYIGKTKSAINRLRDHFISCSDSTQSKIDEIRDLLKKGKEIEVSFVEVPQEVYSSIEEILIKSVDQTQALNRRAS